MWSVVRSIFGYDSSNPEMDKMVDIANYLIVSVFKGKAYKGDRIYIGDQASINTGPPVQTADQVYISAKHQESVETFNDLSNKISLYEACKQKDHDAVIQILQNHNIELDTIVCGFACGNGWTDVLQLFLDQGFDFNRQLAQVELYNNAVHYVMKSMLHIACHLGKTEVVKILLDSGGNVNLEAILKRSSNKTQEKMTPLGLACFNGHNDTIKILLDYNADITQGLKEINGDEVVSKSPLSLACEGKQIDTAKILLERGANAEELSQEWYDMLVGNQVDDSHDV